MSNVVEHVSAREQQDGNQADSRPEVAVRYYWPDVWGSHGEEGNDTQDGCGGDGDFDVVDGTDELGVRAVGELAFEPGLNGVGFGDAVEDKC